MADDNKSLSHTRWNCKYHIVFAPKYRRKIFFGEKREGIGKILRQLCEWKGVEIREAEICPGHVHMLVSIPPKVALSSFMGYLKEKSSLLIYGQYNGNQHSVRSFGAQSLLPIRLTNYYSNSEKDTCQDRQKVENHGTIITIELELR